MRLRGLRKPWGQTYPPPLCNAGAEIGYGPVELPAEYWHVRAERLRDIADFVDEQAREILLRIAGMDEARTQAPKQILADTGS